MGNWNLFLRYESTDLEETESKFIEELHGSRTEVDAVVKLLNVLIKDPEKSFYIQEAYFSD